MRRLNSGLVVVAAVLLSSLFSPPVEAQMRYSTAPTDPHQHIYAILPLIGSGTVIDPIRPMFVPAQGFKAVLPATSIASTQTARTGIIGYHAEISDDGKSAIVEFVAPSLNDFKDILSTVDSRVQVFQRGVQGKDIIEAAFKAVKKDFSFDRFLAMGVK
jgi:hypothetical protein